MNEYGESVRYKDHAYACLKCLLYAFVVTALVGCKGISASRIDNLGNILANIASELPAVWRMLIALSYVMGIAISLTGMFRLKKYGQQTVMMMSSANIGEPMIFLFTGAMLLYLPSTMNALVETAWGYGISHIGSGGGSSMAPNWDEVIDPVMKIMQVIGLVALIRGISSLTRLAGQSQPGVLGKAVVHIVGGTLAINIYGTVDVIQNTLF